MSFFEAITICLKKYATFSGRATRSEFWYFFLFYAICNTIAPIMDIFLFDTIYGMFFWIVYIVTLLPYLAVWVRRLHDIGKSGWAILITIIPFIGGLWFLILMVKNSQEGANQYGPNPKDGNASVEEFGAATAV